MLRVQGHHVVSFAPPDRIPPDDSSVAGSMTAKMFSSASSRTPCGRPDRIAAIPVRCRMQSLDDFVLVTSTMVSAFPRSIRDVELLKRGRVRVLRFCFRLQF